mmetsp:Transcript_13487/g.25238  ORF Transcript_13487/g.25238 Transcript_13487/m.25238 type:complete len:223 (-) Transcript_13487:319-987(-)
MPPGPPVGRARGGRGAPQAHALLDDARLGPGAERREPIGEPAHPSEPPLPLLLLEALRGMVHARRAEASFLPLLDDLIARHDAAVGIDVQLVEAEGAVASAAGRGGEAAGGKRGEGRPRRRLRAPSIAAVAEPGNSMMTAVTVAVRRRWGGHDFCLVLSALCFWLLLTCAAFLNPVVGGISCPSTLETNQSDRNGSRPRCCCGPQTLQPCIWIWRRRIPNDV